jgi:hypothetical protein
MNKKTMQHFILENRGNRAYEHERKRQKGRAQIHNF